MDHPNFLNIKFIIHPLLREKLHVTTDIPSLSLDDLLKEYNELFNNNLLVHKKEDYSDKNDYFLNSIDEDIKNKVLAIIKNENL